MNKTSISKMYKRILAFMLAFVMVVGVVPVTAGAQTTTDITSNMIAYYDFEGVDGTTVPNKVSDVYPGTLVGGIATEADTKWGTSLKFANDINQYMQIDSIINTVEKSYSISLWYKLDTTLDRGAKNTVLLQQNNGGRSLLTLTSGNVYNTYVATQNVYSDNAVDVNEWQHVTFVYDTESNQVSFYANGVLDSTKNAGSGDVNELTSLLIGRHKNNVTDPLPMNGLVDELRVYEGVITAEQAAAIYAYGAEEEDVTVDVNLLKGESYTVTGDDSLVITAEPDAEVATASITEKLITNAPMYNHVSNTVSSLDSFAAEANSEISLSDAEFTFIASGDNWKIYNEEKNVYWANSSASSFFASAVSEAKVTASTETEGAFTICQAAGTRYIIFYNTNMDFNTNTSHSAGYTGGSYDLILLEKQNVVSEADVIPGYKQATEIVDGNNYLIAYRWPADETNVFVLYPTNGTANQTKLVKTSDAITTTAQKELTITATGVGTTSVAAGDVTYNVNVAVNPADSSMDYDVAKITATTGSENPSTSGDTEGPLSYAFDGNEGTWWHSDYTNTQWWTIEGANMQDYLWIKMEFEEATWVDAIRYLPRGMANGNITGYRIEGTADGETWETLKEGTWEISGWQLAEFDAVKLTAVRLVATATQGTSANDRFANAKELRVRTADVDEPEVTPTPEPTPEPNVLYAIDAAVLAENAKANSEQLPVAWDNDGGAAWAFDEEAHWWHSRYQNFDQRGEHETEDGLPSSENPIWIQTGFDQEWFIDYITYLPRQAVAYGRIKDYTVSVANLEDASAEPTDEDFVVVKTGTLENVGEAQTIALDRITAATHVRITVTSVNANGGTAHVAAQKIEVYGYINQQNADTDALQAKVDEYAAVDKSAYTPSTVAVFEEALADAAEVLAAEGVRQAEVDAAAAALVEAYGALVEKADKAELESLIAECDTVDVTGYTEVSVAAFEAALASAKEVAANEEALQEEVDAAVEALAEAYAGLEKEATVLEIVTQPVDVVVLTGENAVATVEAVGDGLTYTWYYKNPGNVKFYESGADFANGNTYTIPMYKWRDGQQVYCLITDAYGNSVQTETVTLTIRKAAVEIVKQPEDVTVEVLNDVATITVEAVGEGLTYTWYYKNPGNVKFYLSGDQFVSEDGTSYIIPVATWRNGQQVYCVITDATGATVQTNTVTLRVAE